MRNASPQFCPARPQRDDGRKRGSGARGVGCRPALPTPLCPLSRRSLRGRCPRPRTRCCCSSWRGPSSPSGCCGAGGAGRGDASPSRPPRAPRSRRRSRFCFSRTAKAEPPSAPGGAAAGSRGPLGAVGRPAGAQTAAGSGRCQAGAQPGPPPRIKVAFLARLWLCVLPWGVGGHPVGIPRRAPSFCHPAVRSLRAPNEAGALRAAPPVRGRARCQPAPRVGSVRFCSPARDAVVARCHRLQRDPPAPPPPLESWGAVAPAPPAALRSRGPQSPLLALLELPLPPPPNYPRKKGRGAFKVGLAPLGFVYISLRAASTASHSGGSVIPPPDPPHFFLPLPPGSAPPPPPAPGVDSVERSRAGEAAAPLGARPRGADSFGPYQSRAGGGRSAALIAALKVAEPRARSSPLRAWYGPDPPPLCYWLKCSSDVPPRQSALGRPNGEGACLSDTPHPSRALIGCGAGHAARLRGTRAAI